MTTLLNITMTEGSDYPQDVDFKFTFPTDPSPEGVLLILEDLFRGVAKTYDQIAVGLGKPPVFAEEVPE